MELAPAMVSSVGALLGVGLGAGLTYALERKAERDRRNRQAAKEVIEQLKSFIGLLSIVFTTPKDKYGTLLFDGEEITCKTVQLRARRIEDAASRLSDEGTQRDVGQLLYQSAQTRADILAFTHTLLHELKNEYTPVIEGVRQRNMNDDKDGNWLVNMHENDLEEEPWPGPATPDFGKQAHERLGLPRGTPKVDRRI